VRRKADGQILCRKEINYQKLGEKEKEQLQAEFSILESLKHKNIVRYSHHEKRASTGDVYLYMEYCGGGDLGTIIKKLQRDSITYKKPVLASEEFVWRILSQLLSALYRCHYGQHPPPTSKEPGMKEPKTEEGKEWNMILHRDIKPENVFLGDGEVVKLGDFGLSKLIESTDFASTYVGTPFYMSPEIYNGEKYTLEADVWAVGCLIYELCTHQPPFPANSQTKLVEKVLKGSTGEEFQADFRRAFRNSSLPNVYSEELQNVILRCLKPNPRHRPKTYQLLGQRSVWMQRREQELEEWAEQLREEQSALEANLLKRQQEMELQMQNQMQKDIKEAESTYRLKVDMQGQQKLQSDTERLRGRFETEVAERVTVETARFVENFKLEATCAAQVQGESRAGGQDPISRPQTSLSHVDPFMQSITTSTSPDEDSLTTANTSFGSLSIQTSPKPGSIFEKKEKLPIPKRQRVAYCRSKTSFESPGDIHMSDPSPMSISSLNLSPRRTVPAPPTHFPRGNIFAEAEAARQKWEPRLAYTTDDEEDDDDVLDFLNNDSPIRPKPIKLTSDPMKPPPPQLRPGRPNMVRQHTTAAVMQTLSNKPALLPSKRSKAADVRAALAAGLKPPRADIARSATESNLNARPVSPPRNRRLSKIPSSTNLKADAATSPKRGLTSKLAPKGVNRNQDSTGTGGEEMLKAVHARNLGGKTLVELSQERQMRGVVAEGDRDLCAPVWDPEVCGEECMPSPFLKRDVRNVLGMGNGNVVRGLR
jgi:serine/threonine protein kinase